MIVEIALLTALLYLVLLFILGHDIDKSRKYILEIQEFAIAARSVLIQMRQEIDCLKQECFAAREDIKSLTKLECDLANKVHVKDVNDKELTKSKKRK